MKKIGIMTDSHSGILSEEAQRLDAFLYRRESVS